jgi:predicted dinucleotide-binding enzyme
MFPAARVESIDYVGATQKADIVFLCVPFAHQAPTMAVIAPHLREGQIIVDCIVPLAAAVGARRRGSSACCRDRAAEQPRSGHPPA